MRARKYKICAEWLNNLMIMMLYFIVAEWFFCVIKLRITPLYTVMFALIITAAYLARVYISRLPVYLAVHLAMWTAVIVIPLTTAYKVLGIVALLIFTICDLFFWTSGVVRSFSMVHPVGVSVFLLVFIYASFYGDAFLIKDSYVCGILFAAACFVRTYLLNAVKFSTDIQPGSNAPEDEIFRNNGRTVCVLVTLFTLLMFFIQSDSLARGLRTLIRLVYAGVRSFLIFLLSLLQKGAEQVTEEGAKAGMMFDPGPYKSLPVWVITLVEALEKLIILLAFVIILFFLIKAIAAFFRIYFERRGYKISMTDREAYVDVEERIRHGAVRRRRRSVFIRDEREKLRRKYKREVEDLVRKGYVLKREQTPGERAIDVEKEYGDPGDFAELTGKYEECRYGKG